MRIISARVSITRPSVLYTDTVTHSWSLDKRGKSDGIVLSLTASFTDARGPGLGPMWTLFNAPVTLLFVQFPETLFGLVHFLRMSMNGNVGVISCRIDSQNLNDPKLKFLPSSGLVSIRAKPRRKLK